MNSEQSSFSRRHIGPSAGQQSAMLNFLGLSDMNDLIANTIPKNILNDKPISDLRPPCSEAEALNEIKAIAQKNKVFRSYLGLGYYDCVTPAVIQRNLFENPSWYTQYTPYQAEISQGRMESLLNFQQMIIDLTGLPIANASLLDESTAAAEALSVCDAEKNPSRDRYFLIDQDCFPQTIEVVKGRAKARGIIVKVGSISTFKADPKCFGALVQYPNANGEILDHSALVKSIHQNDGLVVAATDLLALTLITPPGEWGADFAVGSAQRFGVPLGYGGPHAGFFTCREDFMRRLPGRVIGVSKDAQNNPALRLSLQTREQHIRREKATSNICTAQALLANMAAMYALFHGPDGIKAIAKQVHQHASNLATASKDLGLTLTHESFFDTIAISTTSAGNWANEVVSYAEKRGINLRKTSANTLVIALDETTKTSDIEQLTECLSLGKKSSVNHNSSAHHLPAQLTRKTPFLTHPVFNSFHSETDLMRYIHKLASRDLSLTHSMIPLGSCTMKLNAASELMPVSWPEFAKIHPFAPRSQAAGYEQIFAELETMLCQITGFDAFSLQPNSGAQGEYAGLLVIREYFSSRNEQHRDICLIPSSAHGTNPASAAMAGLKVVVVNCDTLGNIDVNDLKAKATAHAKSLACLMITYPSTHGVFEESIREICETIHKNGGQVYMDGANMNAQVGLCQPGKFGPDVCHLNLHKTFCIPHGGGGPGIGPIGVKNHLKAFLPSHPFLENAHSKSIGPITASPYGSASILPISWMYIRMMGEVGLKKATETAILNANYIARRLEPHFSTLYKGKNGLVAHECIIDLRPVQKTSGITVEDVAKRLMDFGFHAPTMAWPVAGTLMIEPTESESKGELDRFCDAMIAIREEIRQIEAGKMPRDNNPLKNAPHTAAMIASDTWDKPYSRSEGVFPLAWVAQNKFWPAVARVDNAFGDRNFVCSCPPIESYS